MALPQTDSYIGHRMIPWEDWIRQMLGYGHLIANDIELRKSWLEGNRSETSITDFDELYEQIFDDLDSHNMRNDLKRYIKEDAVRRRCVEQFIDALEEIDKERRKNPALNRPGALLDSVQWKNLRIISQLMMSRFSED